MPNYDELLEKKLEALEKGEPLEGILADMPEEAKDLIPLLRLASDIRALPHPLPVNALARASLESIAAREKTRPVAYPRILAPQPRILSPQPRNLNPLPRILNSFSRTLSPQPRLRLAAGFFAAALVILLTFVAFFSLKPQGAQAATVMDLYGVARVATNDGEWKPVQDGDTVRAGERIITGPNSSLTLVFFEGSRMTLNPYSYVTLTELDGGWGKSLHLVATQHTGTTQNSVVPLRGAESAYKVVTPAGVVSVHGTNFSVAVGLEGTSRFAVETGKVVVSGQGSELSLEAGQAASAIQGQLPSAPDYQFSLKGQVTSIVEDTWIVDGVSFVVPADMMLTGNPAEGSFVEVEGRITQEGDRVADSIAVEESDEAESSFTGILQSIDGNTWLIGVTPIIVGENTDLGKGVDLTQPVEVKFTVDENGNWVALEIKALEDEGEEAEATEPPEDTETISPTETVSKTTFVNCTGANPQPKAMKLVAEHGVSYEEIMGLFCEHHLGFGEIDRMFTLSETRGVTWTEILDLRLSGLGWGVIKKLPTTTFTTTMDISPTILGITPTIVPTYTLLPTTTETVSGFLATVPAKNNRSCPQEQDIPKAQTLAAQYGTLPEAIMGLFCKGFGFGEIEKALKMNKETGAPIGQILGWRVQGMGWGEIKKLPKELMATTPMIKPKNNQGQGNQWQGSQWQGNQPGHGGPPGRGPKPTPKPKKNK